MKPDARKYLPAYLGLLLLFLAATGTNAAADIYMYIDSNGILHFSNVPTSSQYRIYIKERPGRDLGSANPRSFDRIIREAAQTHGLSEPLLKAIIKAESNFNPRRYRRKAPRA